ncbi:bifunctional folylpolyglutamate synthase/dihydrofolate synthase [Bacillus sp. Marseille-P3661]|uniref:bifunctional folylpolyglutamate synthase/dihydrofolate synthase n=1 Tax=Bacillus sp. Marseille-P3661 TaxID=1936234 RepID=UPI000C83F13B|nr:folylpolyglutamate synthase/dihydrofolate synthase family protein [Bacillus sp. Marseille-P3661]
MINTYNAAVEYVHSAAQGKMIFGLEQIQQLLEELGQPHQELKLVHISGTNGKGSTLKFLKSILNTAGYKVGAFTSPFIEKINEQIMIGNKQISDSDFLEEVNILKPSVDKLRNAGTDPTPFEILTALAFNYFRRNEVDIALVETGLGGRLDSTNVVIPLLSIITNIGHDHMNILGDTIEEITTEKAGIIKQGVPVISGVEQLSAIEIISHTAVEHEAELYLLHRDFNFEMLENLSEHETFSFKSPFSRISDLEISLKGEHQYSNASLALMAADYLSQNCSFALEEEDIRKGLKRTTNKGRFEMISKNPIIILDGAHNPEGIESLCKTLQKYYFDKKIKLLFSALGDKSLKEMIQQLEVIADSITFTTFDFPRATKAKVLYDIATTTNKQFYESWEQALVEVKKDVKDDEVLVITGSIYFLAVVRERVINHFK